MIPTSTALSDKPLSIFAVVVIYRIAPMRSSSVTSLLAAARIAASAGLRLRIRVVDNTPGGQVAEDLPPELEYFRYSTNPGLAQPYNDALQTAIHDGFSWLLTLDQDTDLPAEFLIHMAAEARRYSVDEQVGAIVPHMVDQGRPISPLRYVGGFIPVVLPLAAGGLAPRHASAINSGSLVRCEALASVGGYDPEFPLHNSDTRLYQQLDRAGLRIAIADVVVPHELSILKRESRMTPERYRHMLWDERVFWDRHMGIAGRTERMVRLLGRYAKGVLYKEKRMFQRATAEEIRYRLCTRRGVRQRKVRRLGL